MSNRYRNREGGFQIYGDAKKDSSRLKQNINSTEMSALDRKMEIAFMHKQHANTKIIGFLEYQGEIKGIRYFDAVHRRFIDIAPWQLNMFPISKLKIVGIRSLELIRYESGDSPRTLLVEFLTQHEIEGIYRPNRMVSNELAEALSKITNELPEEEYHALIREFKQTARKL